MANDDRERPIHTTHTNTHDIHDGTLNRNLLISIVLNGIIVVVEVAGGVIPGSLSLLSDAMHNLSDVAGLSIVYIARRFGRKGPTPTGT